MKLALKIFLKTLLVLILLLVLLITSLYLPPVQRWAVDRLTAYLEEETGLEVSIGSVHLSPLLDLSLGQLHIAKPPTDAIDVERAIVDLDLTRLLTLHVGVEAVELTGGNIRMNTLVEALALNGKVGSIRVEADDIDLRRQMVRAADAALDGCVLDIVLRETPEDTTESKPVEWLIDVKQVKIQDSKIKVQNAPPGFMLTAAIRKACLDAGDINLSQGAYRVGKVSLVADSLLYDATDTISNTQQPRPAGLDVNHLALRDAELQLDKFSYDQSTSALNVQLKRLAFTERSGFRLDNLAVNLSLDSTHLAAAGLDLRTPNSSASGNANLDWHALTPRKRGQLKADVEASLGSEDVLLLAAAYMPDGLADCYPAQPLNIGLRATGNVDSLSLETCHVVMPTVLDAHVDGALLNVSSKAKLTLNNIALDRQKDGYDG